MSSVHDLCKKLVSVVARNVGVTGVVERGRGTAALGDEKNSMSAVFLSEPSLLRAGFVGEAGRDMIERMKREWIEGVRRGRMHGKVENYPCFIANWQIVHCLRVAGRDKP